MEPSSHRHLSVILFTDVKSYSYHVSKNEAVTMEMLQLDMDYMREMTEAYDGMVMKGLGDGLMIRFDSASQAVAFARALQEAFAQRQRADPETEYLQHRIGIHLGDMYEKNGDLFGDGVNVASRLEGIADPGGIALSQTVYEVVRSDIHEVAEYIGEPELKNISYPVGVYKIHSANRKQMLHSNETLKKTVSGRKVKREDSNESKQPKDAKDSEKKPSPQQIDYLIYTCGYPPEEARKMSRKQAASAIQQYQKKTSKKGFASRLKTLFVLFLLTSGAGYAVYHFYPNLFSKYLVAKQEISTIKPTHEVTQKTIMADGATEETHHTIELTAIADEKPEIYRVPEQTYQSLKKGSTVHITPSQTKNWERVEAWPK